MTRPRSCGALCVPELHPPTLSKLKKAALGNDLKGTGSKLANAAPEAHRRALKLGDEPEDAQGHHAIAVASHGEQHALTANACNSPTPLCEWLDQGPRSVLSPQA